MPKQAPDTQSIVLLVGLPVQSRDALGIVLQGQGFAVIEASSVQIARVVLGASSMVCAVVCRCGELAEDGTTSFPVWLADHHPGLGMICICNATTHDHGALPATCQVLSPPFDAQDVARALSGARLDAFSRSSPD